MRKTFRGRIKNYSGEKEFRINEKIFAREIIVIDEEGKNLGLMPRDEAISQARERDLDLMEVSPKATPPICKFLNYGSFKYQQEKQERKQRARQKTVEVKTIKISMRISEHDLDIRANQALKFLTGGDKVRIEMQLKGRENQHVDLAEENIKKFIAEIGKKLTDKELRVEQEIKKQGNRFSAVVAVN